MMVVSSWSGGKDSCYACYKAMSQGHKVSHLLTMISREFQRSGAHGARYELMYQQSQAVGIPMVQRQFNRDAYELEFKTALLELKEKGVRGLVTGDIHLEDSREWVERVCRESGIEPIMPLWGLGQEEVLNDFREHGFKAIVLSARADLLDDSWLGRSLDMGFVRDLRSLKDTVNIDLCGEMGEYHTLVTDGPIFSKRIEIGDRGTVLREGMWFLDVSYRLAEKGGDG
ncbi:diphthine--ammonia ligase [Chloroflexota bacterium]